MYRFLRLLLGGTTPYCQYSHDCQYSHGQPAGIENDGKFWSGYFGDRTHRLANLSNANKKGGPWSTLFINLLIFLGEVVKPARPQADY